MLHFPHDNEFRETRQGKLPGLTHWFDEAPGGLIRRRRGGMLRSYKPSQYGKRRADAHTSARLQPFEPRRADKPHQPVLPWRSEYHVYILGYI